jgi:hypothetical protein
VGQQTQTPQWEYVEVVLGRGRKSWKIGSGPTRKLKKGQLGEAMTTLGRDGWELAGMLPDGGDAGTAWLCFKRPFFDAAPPSLIVDPSPAGPVGADATGADATGPVAPE